METLVAHTEIELEEVAKRLLTVCEEHAREGEGKPERATLMLLQGDLGAGKTALTKALARVLCVTDTVNSPTFVIMKTYPISQHPKFTTLVHIDAYRIDNEDELRPLRFDEILRNPQNLIVIEWPEKIHNALPKDVPITTLTIGKDNERIITYGK